MSLLRPKSGLALRGLGLLAIALGTASCSSKLVGRDLDNSSGGSAAGGQSASAATGGAIVPQGGSSVSAGGSTPAATATGGANAATGGANAATGGANAATGGANAATGGANAATGGANAATGGANAATGGADFATGGSLSTGGAATVTGGAANTTGGTASVGGSAPDDCRQLNCLASHRFIYQANRRWQRTPTSNDPIPESEYTPVTGEPLYLVSFSANGTFASLAQVVSTKYPDPAGTSGNANLTSTYYDFSDGWTGERLIVNQLANGLEGDLTFWGSGVPIIDATRGPLQMTHDYDDQGDQCGLPLGVMPDDLPRTYDAAIASGAGCGKRCAGVRNGYCNGACPGYLVWEDRCWEVPITVAYDTATHTLVGYAWGDESAVICRGKFPPHTADGGKGWDMSQLDVNLTCD